MLWEAYELTGGALIVVVIVVVTAIVLTLALVVRISWQYRRGVLFRLSRGVVDRRSPDGTIMEFKGAAFVVAVADQVPIVPAAIHGSLLVLPPRHRTIRGGHLHVAARRSLPVTGLVGDDVASLRDQARDAVSAVRRDLVTGVSAKGGTS